MTSLVQNVTTFFSLGTVILQIFLLCILIGIFFLFTSRKGEKEVHKFAHYISKYVIEIGFLASLSALFGSLFYSSIAGFEPCEFCWWQRIFIYPQAVIFAVALYYKNVLKKPYDLGIATSLVMSVVGLIVSFYQYYAQLFNPDLLAACAVNGPSCSKLFFVSFGYITMPLMSVSIFAVMIGIVITHKLVLRRRI